MKECACLTGPSKHLGTIGCQFESCPGISTAPRHISIHCRKILKYSYILQMSVSICRFTCSLQSAKIVPWKKCIFESSLKNTETQQGGLHGEASIGSTETAMVSDDHYSETKWAEHKKLVCREFSFIIMHAA